MTIFQKAFLFFVFFGIQFFIARILLFFSYSDFFSSLEFSQVVFGFLEGMKFDFSSISILLAIPILCITFPLSICHSKYWSAFHAWLIYILFIACSFVLIGDIIYFGFVKRHLSNELFFVATEIPYLFKEAVNYLHYLIFAVLFLFFLGWVWYKWIQIPVKQTRFHSIKFILLILTLFIVIRGGFQSKSLNIVDAFSSGNSYYGNLILNGVFTASNTMVRQQSVRHSFFTEQELIEILNLEKDIFSKDFPLEKENIVLSKEPKYNLVVLMIESLSHKYVDSFGNNNYQVTPFLDQLAKESAIFQNFFAHGQRSVDGIQAMLTGVPNVTGVNTVGTGLSAKYTKLAELAKQNDYFCFFVSSMPRDAFRTDSIAGAVGFKHYFGKEDIPMLLEYPSEQPLGWDYETFMFTLDQLENTSKPFFAFVFGSTDHTPYPDMQEQFQKYPYERSDENGYLNTLYYTDWAIKEFINQAKTKEWFDNTIFLIVGDHVNFYHQTGGYLEKFHVPLIIYAPKILPPQEINTVVSQLDLMPTLIELLKLSGKYTTLGENIFNKQESFAWVQEGSVIGAITDKGYLKHSLKNRLEEKIFDSQTSDDELNKLEKKLLALDQLTYKLLQSNRWAK